MITMPRIGIITAVLAIALTGCGGGNGNERPGGTAETGNTAPRAKHYTFHAVRSYLTPSPSIFVDVFDWTTDGSGNVTGTYYTVDENDPEEWKGKPFTGTQSTNALKITINRGELSTPWLINGTINGANLRIDHDLYAQTVEFTATDMASVKKLIADFKTKHVSSASPSPELS